jgi:hypothetical protein
MTGVWTVLAALIQIAAVTVLIWATLLNRRATLRLHAMTDKMDAEYRRLRLAEEESARRLSAALAEMEKRGEVPND